MNKLATGLIASLLLAASAYGVPAAGGTMGIAGGHGNGTSVPVQDTTADSGNRMIQKTVVYDQLAVSIIPGTTINTSSSQDWFDTTGFSSMVLDIQFHGGSCTVYVETTSTTTGSATPPATTNRGVVQNQYNTDGIKSITSLGKFTRVIVNENTAGAYTICATVSIGAVLRR